MQAERRSHIPPMGDRFSPRQFTPDGLVVGFVMGVVVFIIGLLGRLLALW